jgi:hypothetical protein
MDVEKVRLPEPADYAVADRLEAEARTAGVGTALLAAMIIRGLGGHLRHSRREDPRVTALRPESLDAPDDVL